MTAALAALVALTFLVGMLLDFPFTGAVGISVEFLPAGIAANARDVRIAACATEGALPYSAALSVRPSGSGSSGAAAAGARSLSLTGTTSPLV